ncbi:MAG: tetratricopeptide repeat protein [Litorivicinus sp.]
MRLGVAAAAVLLVGCAGTQVAPPVVDGTQAADAQDRIRQGSASAPAQRSTPATTSVTQPVEVAKIEAQPAPATSAGISPAVLDLLEQADQQASDGNNQGALATLERALRIAPREPEVYYQMGRLRLDMGEPKQAEQLALKAVDLAPDAFVRRDGWNLVALAREAAGDKAGAAAARAAARGA